jgi:hypothetical protein
VFVDNVTGWADEFSRRCPALLLFGGFQWWEFFFKLGSASGFRCILFLKRGLTSERGSALYARASEFISNLTMGAEQFSL